MKIIHVVRQFHPGIGGVENYVHHLAREQDSIGHQVRIVTLNRIFDGDGSELKSSDRLGNVEIVRVPFFGHRKYPIAFKTLKHLAASDIVHVHGIDFFADYIGLTRTLHRKPLVISTHGGFFHTEFAKHIKAAWFRSITRLTLSRYTTVIASSAQDAVRFREIAAGKTVQLENAVDYRKFQGLAQKGSRTLIYFGRLAPNKGLSRLIAWFARFQRERPEWRLIIAGKEMGTSVSSLEQAAVEGGVAHAATFHAQPTDDELAALIARSSVFACASHYEGFGLAAVEAVGAGLYPLLSDIPPFRRTLERLGVGMVVDFDLPFASSDFLQNLEHYEATTTPEDLEARLRPFGWNILIKDMETIYGDAVETHRSGSRRPKN